MYIFYSKWYSVCEVYILGNKKTGQQSCINIDVYGCPPFTHLRYEYKPTKQAPLKLFLPPNEESAPDSLISVSTLAKWSSVSILSKPWPPDRQLWTTRDTRWVATAYSNQYRWDDDHIWESAFSFSIFVVSTLSDNVLFTRGNKKPTAVFNLSWSALGTNLHGGNRDKYMI